VTQGTPSTVSAAAAAPDRLLKIHEVAAETGLTPRTIRYYEELGLLEPAARSEGAYRLYDAEDLDRLRFIRGLRDDAGFSLAEIGLLLEDETVRARNRLQFRASADAAERAAILEDAIGRVDRQVTTLRHKIERLGAMVEEAQRRRRHLIDHLSDVRAGREPRHRDTTATEARGRRR
jgi:DNA-binding transcriptional MerR regulator